MALTYVGLWDEDDVDDYLPMSSILTCPRRLDLTAETSLATNLTAQTETSWCIVSSCFLLVSSFVHMKATSASVPLSINSVASSVKLSIVLIPNSTSTAALSNSWRVFRLMASDSLSSASLFASTRRTNASAVSQILASECSICFKKPLLCDSIDANSFWNAPILPVTRWIPSATWGLALEATSVMSVSPWCSWVSPMHCEQTGFEQSLQ